MKPGEPLFAFIVLLIVHSVISLAAYKLLTTSTRTALPVDTTPVETTTPAQRARGESSFQIATKAEQVTVAVPWVVYLYVIFGYTALLVAGVVAVVTHFRGID